MAEPKAGKSTPSPQQMRVLVLGLPRTTTSIVPALRILGYNPYTMRHLASMPSHIPVWHDAARSTPRASGLPMRIDAILSAHDSVADLPGCMFAAQLIEAYPSAKVILTTRSYERWEKSMQESIWVLFTWRLFEVCRITGLSQMAPLIRLLHALFGMHNGNVYGEVETRRAFEEHNQRVRELVPRERLLEIDAEDTASGWNELCGFLEVERPHEGTPYPAFKEDRAMRAGLEAAWVSMVKYLILMVLVQGLVVIAGMVLYVYAEELREVRDVYVLGPLKAYLDK